MVYILLCTSILLFGWRLVSSICWEIEKERKSERPHPSTDLRKAEYTPNPEVEYVRGIRGER